MKHVEFTKSLKASKAYLHFKDRTFEGFVNRKNSDTEITSGIWGEAAFTTGMAGYQETMTDPSFLGQHIIFTTSHVGNYPSDERVAQSEKCHASCVIARNFSPNTFIENLDVPLFSGVDTRSLVRFLTTAGVDQKSVLTFSAQRPALSEFKQATLTCNQLQKVSQEKSEVITAGDHPIVLINYGVKRAIIQNLKAMGLPLVSVPYNISAQDVLALSPRMIFLSNGPGDPSSFINEIQVVRQLLAAQTPIRGICLGHQLLTLALGGETIKLPFGQRGVNHPVLDHTNGEIIITSQNHGYAAKESSLLKLQHDNMLGRELIIQHRSLFDQSVEGMSTTDHFLKSVQFHPEANPGPSDACVFFQEIENYLKNGPTKMIDARALTPLVDLCQSKKKAIPYKRVLIIGSGPIKIGQASEFDYSGTQACKSLKELGIEVVLLNSNPATIMTDPEMAYATYIEPITKEIIKKIVLNEKVDAVLSTMGGQTALNICIELEEENFLSNHQVALLGANVDTIKKTEDRDLFAKELSSLGYQTGKRFKAHDKKSANSVAAMKAGYPLIIRRDFALGGMGAALVYNEEELEQVLLSDISYPITMEKSLLGWKEIELEVMVDSQKNGVIICSIENVDPCGIHTGDSITVAPAQTISDRCYQNLRTMALTIAKHMGVVAGGANVQFAINPTDEDDIVVIEMNPRVSRSSALASKATGYPIAKISAQLAVGLTLKEILNDITLASPVAFEPTLDYVAVKIPLFPFDKFPSSSQILGPQMRSVGEVLALGGSFNEAFMKALRSLEIGLDIPKLSQLRTTPFKIDTSYLKYRLKERYQLSLLTVLEAIRKDIPADDITNWTKIDPWFVDQMEEFFAMEKEVIGAVDVLSRPELLLKAKKEGMSDKYLSLLIDRSIGDTLRARYVHGIIPVYKAVDTCSAEFKAITPYFYSTYAIENEAIPLRLEGETVAIFGSGPNRIGQGIEFDYSCVKSCMHLRTQGVKAIMLNSNPETVSTDYDSSDRLYITPLFSEDLFDILAHEKPDGIITSFSGQTGINIRSHIEADFRSSLQKFNFLGPDLKLLDLTEDRKQFAAITRETDLSHTQSVEVSGHKHMLTAMTEIGLPVIIRPSYVIGGESMYIFHHHDDIENLPLALQDQLKNSSTIFQVENYIEKAREYDVDLVRDRSGHVIFTVCEHIEQAGVHSGDSGMINPPVHLTRALYDKMKSISITLATKLGVVGPINFQYAIKGEKIFCIEANPRGSRTLPFLSKAYNIGLIDYATDAMRGKDIPDWDRYESKVYCVKQSTFPFDRYLKDNIILGPKMRSTGETLGIDRDLSTAILKSYLGNYPKIQGIGKVLVSLAEKNKEAILPSLVKLAKLGHRFMATSGTCRSIRALGLECERVTKIDEEDGRSILDATRDPELILVFNTPLRDGRSESDGEIIRNTAIQMGVPCFTREENILAVIEALTGREGREIHPISLQSIHREE